MQCLKGYLREDAAAMLLSWSLTRNIKTTGLVVMVMRSTALMDVRANFRAVKWLQLVMRYFLVPVMLAMVAVLDDLMVVIPECMVTSGLLV